MVQNGGFHDKTEQMGFWRITDVLFTKTNFNNTGREKNKIRKQPPGFCLVTCEVLLNSKMPSFCASAYTGYCSFYCLMTCKGWQVVADCRLKPLIEIHTKYTPTLAIISNGYTGGVFLGYPGAESEFSQIPLTFVNFPQLPYGCPKFPNGKGKVPQESPKYSLPMHLP